MRGLVRAEHGIVAERIAEELEAVAAALNGLGLVLMARHRAHQRYVGVDRPAERHAFARADDVVIFGDPFGGLFRLDERERERAHPMAGRLVDALALRTGEP